MSTVAKINDLIDAFGYLETSYDKKDWQTYFKGFAKPILERMTANKSPRLAEFKKGAGEFVKFISEKFADITIYTPKDGDYEHSLIYSYWRNEEDEAPVFLFFLDGMKFFKVWWLDVNIILIFKLWIDEWTITQVRIILLEKEHWQGCFLLNSD